MVVLVLLYSITTFAQFRPHEYAITYGIASAEEINPNIINYILGELQVPEKYENIGPLSIRYQYYYTPYFSIGADIIGHQMHGTYNNPDINQGHMFRFLSLMPRLNLAYYFGRRFQLYSGLAGGVTYINHTTDQTLSSMTNKKINNHYLYPAFQLTALGFRYGRKVMVFAEMGYGRTGMACGGISFKLR